MKTGSVFILKHEKTAMRSFKDQNKCLTVCDVSWAGVRC